MAHNPILDKKVPSRTDIRFVIQHNTVGVLYQGQKFVRMVLPGEGLSAKERVSWGDPLLYIVDAQPHTLEWRVSLPTAGDKDFFATTVNLKYRVADPERMVKEQVADTEKLVARVLEPILRKVARQFRFNQPSLVDTALEEAIAADGWQKACGLERLDPPDVVINLSEADHARIKYLNDLERARKVARAAEHTDELPTADPIYKFKVTVNLSYRVSDPDELPTDSLEEAEQQLWPKLRRVLRQESRKYALTDVSRADAGLQAALADQVDGGLTGFGLTVTAADVGVDLDDDTRLHYTELAQVRHAAALKNAELDGLKNSQAFYTELIQKGDWAVLAVAAAKGEIKTDELYKRLNQQESERLKMQIDLLKTLRADNAKDENQDWKVSQALMDSIAGRVAAPSNPALMAPPPAPQLPAADHGQDTEVRPSETDASQP